MFRTSLEKYVRKIFVELTLNSFTTSQNLPVTLEALINDTTGTLLASQYVHPRTKIACIFGTGCNAAYMENVKDIPKLAKYNIHEDAQIAINCEWVSHLC